MGKAIKHTPGPWRPFIRKGVIAVMRGKGPKNEVVHWSGFDGSHFPEDAIANVFLIAAAPDLKAFAERVMIYQVEGEEDTIYIKFDGVTVGADITSDFAAVLLRVEAERRAAIAKATGAAS